MISSTFDKHHHHRHRYHDDGSYDHHHHQKSEIPLQIHVIAVTDDDDDDANHTVFNDIMLLVYINLHQLRNSLQKPKCYVYSISNITVTHTFMHHRYV